VMQAQMQEMLVDQRNYIEQRDSWLETRLSQLDRRCQKVEVLSDRLHNMLQGFDLENLAAVPREVTKALNTHLGGLSPTSTAPGSPKAFGGSPKALRDVSGLADDPSQPDTSFDGQPGSSMVPHGHSNEHHVGHGHGHHGSHQELKKMSQQLDLLLSHAEATPQMTRLLWRMDLNLRQLTGTASNLPQQPATQQTPDKSKPARQQRQQSPGNNRLGASGSATPTSASAAASRQQSKGLAGISEGGGGFSDM